MDGDPFEVAQESAELRGQLGRLQRQLAQAKAGSKAIVDAVREGAREAAIIVGPAKPVRPPARSKSKRDPECALVHATDWQVGKRTVSYDSEVAADRIRLLAAKVGHLTEIQRSDHPVDHCCLLLGGDMVEGVTVFPGQPWEVDSTLFAQMFHTASMVEGLVLSLLAMFQTVQVVCEYGNHGRIGRKGDVPGSDNIDRVVYEIVSERLENQPRLSWQAGPDFVQHFNVGNYAGLLFHGDEIKSFGGQTPAFGILRKLNAWASGVVDPFTDAYGGHFHQTLTLQMANGGRVFMTGSPESDNVYAKEFVAGTSQPSQRLHFIDPDAGRVSAEYIVWLGD